LSCSARSRSTAPPGETGPLGYPHVRSSSPEIADQNPGDTETEVLSRNALLVPRIAERALVYLFAEENLLSEQQLRTVCTDLALDQEFLARRLADNRRPVRF